MKVYVVKYYDWEGEFFHSIWSDLDIAEAIVKVLNKREKEERYGWEEDYVDNNEHLTLLDGVDI